MKMNVETIRNKYAIPFSILVALFCLFIFYYLQQKKPIVQNNKHVGIWYSNVLKYGYTNIDSELYFTKLIQQNLQNAPSEFSAMAEIGMGIYYHSRSEYPQSLESYKKAESYLVNSKADTLLVRAYIGIGNNYKNIGEYSLSLEFLFKALSLAEKINHTEFITIIHGHLAQVYQFKNEIDNAKSHLRQTFGILKDDRATPAYLIASHIMANIYGEAGMFDSALAIDNEGIQLSDSIHSNSLKSPFYDNKANCFMYSNRFDSAYFYLLKCIAIDSSRNERKQMSDSYVNLGYLAFSQGNYTKAEERLFRALKLSNEVGYKGAKVGVWEILANIYKAQGNLSAALSAKDSLIAIKDTLVNIKTQSRLAELRTIYETEKKERQLREKEIIINKRNYTIVGISIFLVLGGLLSFSMVRRYRLQKENEVKELILLQQANAAKAIITTEDKERRRIAAELHDGVGQLMTAAWLNLQALKHEPLLYNAQQSDLLEKSMNLVHESCKEVRQVSHNMMPNALIKNGLENAIRVFLHQINSKHISINLHTEGLQLPINSSAEAVLYRVIQECVNNTIKHAKATQLDISINHDEKGIDVLIEDNGIGFNTAESNSKDGIGLENVKSRILYLKGKVEWDTAPGKGTLVIINIPHHE